MIEYVDCGGCGRMFDPGRATEVVEYDVHDCLEN